MVDGRANPWVSPYAIRGIVPDEDVADVSTGGGHGRAEGKVVMSDAAAQIVPSYSPGLWQALAALEGGCSSN